jgi:nucleotide-binding universal stress UspA family protein
VAERVMQRSPFPVLTVPASAAASLDHVLCAVDFEPASTAAFMQALALTDSPDTRLTVLHVVPMPEYHSLVTLDAWRTLQGAVSASRRASGRYQVRVVTGDPASQIVKVAGDVQADTIVVGVTARSAIARRVLGTTAARVMRTAAKPVLAVPQSAWRHAAVPEARLKAVA